MNKKLKCIVNHYDTALKLIYSFEFTTCYILKHVIKLLSSVTQLVTIETSAFCVSLRDMHVITDRQASCVSVSIDSSQVTVVGDHRESNWGSIPAALIRSLIWGGSVENKVTRLTRRWTAVTSHLPVSAHPHLTAKHTDRSIYSSSVSSDTKTRVKSNSTVMHIVHWTQIVEGRYSLWKNCELLWKFIIIDYNWL